MGLPNQLPEESLISSSDRISKFARSTNEIFVLKVELYTIQLDAVYIVDAAL